VQGGAVEKKKVPYVGKVYCLTVDSGLFYIRRNGAVMITGNSLHCSFGIDLINTIKQENPHLWTKKFTIELTQLFKKALELEHAYAIDTMPRGVLGLNASLFNEYLRFICARRMEQIGLTFFAEKENNPFPWMSEVIDLSKEKNFFETRVTEYQMGSVLNWE
jgi:ribonucleoside-diphosphate reductase beta chain